MAVFDGSVLFYRKDVYFQAKMTSVDRILFEGEDLYMITFEVNFMRSFSEQYRFRGADINVKVQRDFNDKPSDSEPSIRKIFPTILTVDVSERQIQKNNEVTTGAGATAGSAKLNLSVKQAHQDTTSFKGARKFHGIIKGDRIASWRLYEEKGSQSGIPSIFRIATLIHCPQGAFQIKLEMSARMVRWPKLFGLHNISFDSSYRADTFIQTVPQLSIPVDWRELYAKAEQIFLDDGDSTAPNHDGPSAEGSLVNDGSSAAPSNRGSTAPSDGDSNDEESTSSTERGINGFKERCEAATNLNDKETEMLAKFIKGMREAREAERLTDRQKTVLTKLNVYLATEDESNRVVSELAESMGISAPDKPDASSQEPATSGVEVEVVQEKPPRSRGIIRPQGRFGIPYSDNLGRDMERDTDQQIQR
jgi:hypothetical protein